MGRRPCPPRPGFADLAVPWIRRIVVAGIGVAVFLTAFLPETTDRSLEEPADRSAAGRFR